MAKKRASPRSVRLVCPPDSSGVGIFCVAARSKLTFYAFKEIPCDIGGRGFVVHRLGLGQVYHVRIGGPAECSCECLGFLAHGMCKHIQGLKALLDNQVIEDLP
jgi:hypothetical protein